MRKFLSITHKSLEELGVATYKDLWEHAREKGFGGFELQISTAFTKAKDDGEEMFDFVFSTDSEDRHGDIVKQNPDLKAFKKNPVLLDSHNYGSIEHIIGKVAKIKSSEKDGQTSGKVQFFTDNEKGRLAKAGVEQGFINATSIGFIPTMFNEKNGNIEKWELLEISLVSVPANAEALAERNTVKRIGEFEVTMLEEGKGQYKVAEKSIIVNLCEDEEAFLCMECGAQTNFKDAKERPTETENTVELICASCFEKEEKKEAEVTPPAPQKPTLATLLARIAEKDRAQMRMLARAVETVVREDRDRNKRKLLQAIRNVLASS